MFRDFFSRKKDVKALIAEAADQSKHGLRRYLGPWNLTAIGIGATIGAGIFVLTGQASAQYAGPAIILSMICAALICVFAAFCYAEFASMIPISGSAYSYAYATLGEFTAWVIGLCLSAEYLFAAATVAVGWGSYFVSFLQDLGYVFPASVAQTALSYDAENGWQWTGSFLNLPAVAAIAVVGGMAAIGIKIATSLNGLLVTIKLGVIALFIICGFAFVQADHWLPFIPENTGVFGQFGWSGVFRAAGFIFFGFVGFDVLSTFSQEARNPQKDLPIGMMGSLGIATVVYILIALVMTGVTSYQLLNVPDPVSISVNAMGPRFYWLRIVLKLGILLGLASVFLVMILAQARILYMMAHDGLLPKKFGRIHARYKTPFFTTLVVTGACILMAGFLPVAVLGNMTSMSTLVVFAIVCFGVLYLRRKAPELKRPFKTPLVPWIPLAGIAVCLLQLLFFPLVVWLQFLGWLALGIIVYRTYGKRHSKIQN